MHAFRIPIDRIDDTYIGIEIPNHTLSWQEKALTWKKSNEFKKSINKLKIPDKIIRHIQSPDCNRCRPLIKNDKSLEKLHQIEKLNVANKIDPMFSSFPSFKQESVEVQTDAPPQCMLDHAGTKDTYEWTRATVDPFLKNLRKAVITNKPTNIEEFCLEYCACLINGTQSPTTVPPATQRSRNNGSALAKGRSYSSQRSSQRGSLSCGLIKTLPHTPLEPMSDCLEEPE